MYLIPGMCMNHTTEPNCLPCYMSHHTTPHRITSHYLLCIFVSPYRHVAAVGPPMQTLPSRRPGRMLPWLLLGSTWCDGTSHALHAMQWHSAQASCRCVCGSTAGALNSCCCCCCCGWEHCLGLGALHISINARSPAGECICVLTGSQWRCCSASQVSVLFSFQRRKALAVQSASSTCFPHAACPPAHACAGGVAPG
jgi:hypothetical protein